MTTHTPEINTLSLHDALPILRHRIDVSSIATISMLSYTPANAGFNHAADDRQTRAKGSGSAPAAITTFGSERMRTRSEEHTSELQSRFDLVCRLLLEKKNNQK